MSRTSWSDDDLEKLSRKKNHRVRYNGHNYIWEHRLKGNKWEKHSIDCYAEYRKPLHEIHYWTYNYGKELSERQSKQDSLHYRELKRYLSITARMVRIRENPKLKTRDKIRMVMKTMPKKTAVGIAELLNISRQMVHKHQVEISRGNTSN